MTDTSNPHLTAHALGIDIGGSALKCAPVDLDAGELTRERIKIDTPEPSTPDRVAEKVQELVDELQWKGPIGITFPAVVLDGTTLSAANVDETWIGCDARRLFAEATGQPVCVINDADAAGDAEVAFGAGQGRRGVTLLLTFGTGIGSALFVNDRLVPNTELGHLELDGRDAETHASSAVKDEQELTWQTWAHRVERYLRHVEMLFSPRRIIIGGGISRVADKFLPLITGVRAEVVPAEMRNNAGIVGAAIAAQHEATHG